MKKKLLSLFMACAMILALAVPAFADNYSVNAESDVSDELTQQVTIATRTYIPTVKLTLPTMTEPSVVLNPYKISFEGDTQLLNGYAVGGSNDKVKQVISPVYSILNETDVKLNYTVAVTGSIEGTVAFSNDPISLEEKNKKAHVALMVANKSVSTEPTSTTTADQKLVDGTLLKDSDVETLWLKTSEVKSSVPKTLADASKETGKKNWLAFQFKGDLTRQPTPNSWTADDKIGAVITFTFTPESAQDFTWASTVSVVTGLSQATVDASAATAASAFATTIPANYNAPASPTWKIYNKGAYGADITTDGKIKLDPTLLKAIPNLNGSATTVNDKIVVSFTDKENLPRTVEVPISFTITS